MSDDELQHARRRLDRVNLDALLAEITRRAATIVRWAGDHRAAPFADARREMGHAVAQIGDVLRWLRRDRDALRTERDEALEVLVELVGRDCCDICGGHPTDARATPDHAAKLRELAPILGPVVGPALKAAAAYIEALERVAEAARRCLWPKDWASHSTAPLAHAVLALGAPEADRGA